MNIIRSIRWVLLFSLILAVKGQGGNNQHRRRGLSDFGGDVGQYMSLLKGTSAFSFKPESEDRRSDDENSVRTRGFPGFGKRNTADNDEEYTPNTRRDAGYYRRRSTEGEKEAGTEVPRESGLGDFGGDYGDYLKLLEGKSALGFNPQPDPIADNQDLQSDVFGGGMTGKFWKMYKGSSSYDSLDEEDGEVVEEMGLNDSDSGDVEDDFSRQTLEDYPNTDSRVTSGITSFKDETYIVSFKPAKDKMMKLYEDIKSAFKENDKPKMSKILDSLDVRKLIEKEEDSSAKDPSRRRSRKIMVIKDDEDEDTDDSKDNSTEAEMAKAQFEGFVKKIKDNIPDPIETNKGLSSGYRNLTLYGLSAMKVCGSVKKSFGTHWKGSVCLPNLSSMITSAPGPGVPFKGKVIAIFKDSKIKMTFRLEESSGIHVISVKSKSSTSKFIPTYDSSIPLNPWSKVSMSGYMVSRIKKVMPSVIDKTLLRLAHVVENLDSEK